MSVLIVLSALFWVCLLVLGWSVYTGRREGELLDGRYFALGVVSSLLGLLSGLLWFMFTSETKSCERLSVQAERDTEWFVFGGCFVTLNDGRSVPIDENSIGLLLED